MKKKEKKETPLIKVGNNRVLRYNELVFNKSDNKIFVKSQELLNAKFFPTSQREIKKIVNKAIASGTIRTTKEKQQVIATITAVSVNDVKSRKKGAVRVKNIYDGWKDIKMVGGNCPPHLCVRRSVITRFEQLKKDYPGINLIINKEGKE